jgi:hypothetical protein
VNRPPDPPVEAPPVRRDPHIGLIAGPVTFTRVAEAHRPGIGVVAAGMSALISVLALVATGSGFLVPGSLLALAGAAAVVGADRLGIRRGLESRCRFAVRTEVGRLATWTLLGAGREGLLRPGDLVRVVPGAGGRARAVEVLAGPDGPVVRRLNGRRQPAPMQWAGLAVALVLVVMTVAVLYGML